MFNERVAERDSRPSLLRARLAPKLSFLIEVLLSRHREHKSTTRSLTNFHHRKRLDPDIRQRR